MFMKKLNKVSKTKKKVDDDPLAGDMSEFMKNTKWQRVRFEFKPKNKAVTIRMSEELLNELKKRAEKLGLDYQKYIRMKLEHSIFDDAA